MESLEILWELNTPMVSKETDDRSLCTLRNCAIKETSVVMNERQKASDIQVKLCKSVKHIK